MRFVPVKSTEQQAALMLHRVRDLLVRQRTVLINALRGHLAEFDIIAPQGATRIGELAAVVLDEEASSLPRLARQALLGLVSELQALGERITTAEAAIMSWHRASEVSRRLATIPGIGPITASAITATVTDPSQFQSGRQFAAWIGLVPRQNSSGGKERLGRISKQGDQYLRRLLVLGATVVIRHARTRSTAEAGWLQGLLARRPARLVSIAQANKTARIAWAVLTRGKTYRAPQMIAA
jgi:transposase